MRRRPPDILITTPESLYLILTSAAREMLAGVQTVIVDEIHAARGGQARHPPRALARAARAPDRRRPAADRPLGDPAAARGDRSLPGRRPRRSRSSTPASASRSTSRSSCRSPDMRELRWRAGSPTASRAQSIWPAIYPRLLDLVRAHRSTLVFVNSRRAAERVAHRLNDLAERGARARPPRLDRPRAAARDRGAAEGRPAARARRHLLARARASTWARSTSSSRSSRRSRSPPGSSVSAAPATTSAAASAGRFFPKYRGDLLETAVVARRMREGEIEHTRVPRQPLDVLAQQIVATLAMDEWASTSCTRMVTRAAALPRPLPRRSSRACSTCWPAAIRPTSSPSCGRGSSGTARPASLRGRDGARRLAVTSGGTIPDRGLYGVFLADSGARVGELDEEMVYEARQGEVFQLGATTWRIEQITRDRVLVSPAPGVPGQDAVLAGRRRRPAVRARPGASARRRARAGSATLDELGRAQPDSTYLDDQRGRDRRRARPTARSWSSASATRSATGASACCRRSAAASTRRGRWPSSRAWARRSGIEVESLWTDDGIAHAPARLPTRRRRST